MKNGAGKVLGLLAFAAGAAFVAKVVIDFKKIKKLTDEENVEVPTENDETAVATEEAVTEEVADEADAPEAVEAEPAESEKAE